MYKAHYVGNNTDIFMSEHHGKNAPHVVEIGHSTPPHGYESKPLCRNVWVLHYVVSGEGLYFGQPVTGPCVFIETPDTVQFYAVSDNASAPVWEQYWIMFDGQTAPDWLAYAGFPKVPTVLPCPYMHQAQSIFSELLTSSNYIGQNDHYYMLSGLCRLFALHAATKEKAPRSDSAYVRKIRAYIHDNYATIRSEAELADLVHLSTRYMNKIFKKETGKPPIQYLNHYRIRCAKNLLERPELSIHEISEMLGFSNPNYFCCVFQRHCNGISPLAYRKGAR